MRIRRCLPTRLLSALGIGESVAQRQRALEVARAHLAVRRQKIEQNYLIRKAAAKRRKLEAEMERLKLRLQEEVLISWQREAIEATIAGAKAEVEYWQERTEQAQLELQLIQDFGL